ncbi:S1/P1 nuclease [soil metagenome]
MKCIWVALGVFFAAISLTYGWDPIGHMIACQAAYDNLAPAAKQKVEASLAAFNAEEKADYSFVSAGCWMDDIRGKTQAYNTWHYVDPPYQAEFVIPDPSKENVLYAIHLTTDIIEGKATRPGIDKDQALVMLLHLVGDIHQPLHATSKDDAGGNKLMVANQTDAAIAVMPARGNLHHFWDSAYRRVLKDNMAVEEYPEPPYLLDKAMEGHNAAASLIRERTTRLETSYQSNRYPAGGTAEDWARESHALGYNDGYQKLPGGDTSNPVTLDKTYVDNAREISGERLIQAGHRLANLLNEIYR